MSNIEILIELYEFVVEQQNTEIVITKSWNNILGKGYDIEVRSKEGKTLNSAMGKTADEAAKKILDDLKSNGVTFTLKAPTS